MLKWLIRTRLRAFETKYGYDMGYARELLDTDFAAFMTFARLEKLGRYRKDIPADVLAAAGIVAAVPEDCGPCIQLGVSMALEAGVAPATISAVLEGAEVLMSEEVRLGVHFARATLAHDLAADDLRAEIERRWGKRAVASLAFGIAAARVFPTIKYALGHGHSCVRVLVAGEPVQPLRPSQTPAHVIRALS